MNLVEIFSKLNSGELSAHSELGTRDESKQTRNFGSRISKMKTVTGINARAMVMKDVVIPFNPFTGKADDQYNKKTPFRPILLVSQVLEGLNQACAEDGELKEFWEKELSITLPKDEPTMEEYNAFKAKGYIKPRVMSYSTVAMSFNGAYGFPDFKVKYVVDPTELNESGTYDFDKSPVWHKAAVFFNMMMKPEADDVKRKLEAQGSSKETIQTSRRAVFQKSPVSFVSPTNLIPFLFFPLNEVPRSFDVEHPQELEQCMRYYSFTDKWTIPLKEAMENPMFDEDMDFFDFTIKTPTSQDTKKDGKVYTDEDANELYAAMNISVSDGRLSLHTGSTATADGKTVQNSEAFKGVYDAAKAYFLYSQEQSGIEGGETFEKIMAASNRFRPIQSAMANFLPACNEVFINSFASTPYFTDAIKNANHEFFILMNPNNAMALAEADEDELAEAAEKQKSSVEEIIKENSAVTKDAAALGVAGGVTELELE